MLILQRNLPYGFLLTTYKPSYTLLALYLSREKYTFLQFRHCRGLEGGKEDGECVRRLGWVKYLEETQGGNDLAGLLI